MKTYIKKNMWAYKFKLVAYEKYQHCREFVNNLPCWLGKGTLIALLIIQNHFADNTEMPLTNLIHDFPLWYAVNVVAIVKFKESSGMSDTGATSICEFF